MVWVIVITTVAIITVTTLNSLIHAGKKIGETCLFVQMSEVNASTPASGGTKGTPGFVSLLHV